MALLSVDLKQFGCCSRTILKSPLIVRTFYATSPRKRVQGDLNFVINHVNSNPANKNDFLVSFGVKVSDRGGAGGRILYFPFILSETVV